MLRFTIALLVAMLTIAPAMSADQTPARPGWQRAAARLPAGLPRPHYNFRTTISYSARRAQPFYATGTHEVLFTPLYAVVPYVQPLLGVPLLPGSWTLPGYYGSAYSSDYQGVYYGGPYVGYWDRLPYACGVYGYC